MRKLLSANFSRLKKNKLFWFMNAFMFIYAIFDILDKFIYNKRTNSEDILSLSMFTYIIFAVILMAVFVTLFIGTEYSDATIRNKIIVGHKRKNIYLANLITCCMAGLVLNAVFLITNISLGAFLLGFFKTDIKSILLGILCCLIITITFTSIYVFISMSSANKAGNAVICIFLTLIMAASGLFVGSRLQEPEIFNGAYMITAEGEQVWEEAKENPDYLKGTKRKVFQFYFDCSAGSQLVSFGFYNDLPKNTKQYAKIMFSDAVAVICFTGIGLMIIKRKNIN